MAYLRKIRSGNIFLISLLGLVLIGAGTLLYIQTKDTTDTVIIPEETS